MIYQSLETVFHQIAKHLEVHPKYSSCALSCQLSSQCLEMTVVKHGCLCLICYINLFRNPWTSTTEFDQLAVYMSTAEVKIATYLIISSVSFFHQNKKQLNFTCSAEAAEAVPIGWLCCPDGSSMFNSNLHDYFFFRVRNKFLMLTHVHKDLWLFLQLFTFTCSVSHATLLHTCTYQYGRPNEDDAYSVVRTLTY